MIPAFDDPFIVESPYYILNLIESFEKNINY